MLRSGMCRAFQEAVGRGPLLLLLAAVSLHCGEPARTYHHHAAAAGKGAGEAVGGAHGNSGSGGTFDSNNGGNSGGARPGGSGAGASAGRMAGRGGMGNASAAGGSGETAEAAGMSYEGGAAGQAEDAGSAGSAGDGTQVCAGYTFVATCGGGCGSWTFEADQLDGWAADTDPGFPVNGGENNGVTNVVTSSTVVEDGNVALAVPGLTNGGPVVSVAVPICRPGASTNLAGFTMSAWVYLKGTALDTYGFVFFDAWGPSGQASSPVLTGEKIATMNTWYRVTATFSSTVQADHVAIRLNPGMNWTGTMYIDSVTVTGP